ncbi:hypothetical protein [Pseudoxanthomonas putridarboris]|uniref:hypothetical protein n=1 Tax=Pseudoxanthomonas putridarboris TaxID=752605 RepID=UPI00311D5F2A
MPFTTSDFIIAPKLGVCEIGSRPDFHLEHPLTNELAVVQVNRSATQRELDDFVESFNASQVYTRGFFLHHSSA